MTKKISINFLAIAIFCLLFSTGQIFAQAGSGAITGIVADVNGAVVPNATVKLVSNAKGTELSTTASSDGIYNFTSLEPGKYTVTASGGGFGEQKLDVEVQVGRKTDANFTLGAGSVGAEVLVTAEGVQTTQSNSDAVLSETAIQNLPINGRRFQDFATLTPTAQIDTERNQISLSGQRGINTNINVDGVDYNQPFFGGIRGGERSNFAPTIPQESIKEFQVVAAGYNAEYGRSTGGVVNVVTKGGSNNFRGTAFYLMRPDKLSINHEYVRGVEAARRLIDPNFSVTAAPTQQQFGGSVGGRLVRNKLFFFGSFEQQKFTADRLVAFTGLNSVVRTNANAEAYDYYRSLEKSYEMTNDGSTALGRIDWNPNSANNINFRYSWNKSKGLNSVAVGDAGVLFNPVVNAAISNEGTEIDRNNVFVAQWSDTISSSLVNDFRFQYARGDRPRYANAQTPLVNVTSVGLYGTRSFLPTTQYDTRIQFVEAFSILKSNHNFKFGGEYSDIYANQVFGFNQFGSYTFSGGTAGGLTALSLDPTVPTDRRFDSGSFYTQQIGNLEAAFHIKELAFYGQDSWRITPKFTLNYGLRVEKQFNPEAQTGNDAIINLLKNTSFPLLGGKGYDPTIIPDSEWQVGPRLGFAYDFNGDGKSVFRGFSGLYYARTPGIVIAGPVNNFRIPAGDVTTQLPFTIPAILSQSDAAGQNAYNAFLTANANYVNILTNAGLPCPQVTTTTQTRACLPNTVFRQFALIGINANATTLDNLPSVNSSQLSQIAGRLGLSIVPGNGANFIGMSPGFDNPRSFQFGLGFEREISPGFVIGGDYSQVNTTRLEINRDINLPVPTLDANGRYVFNRNNRPTTAAGAASGLNVGRLLLRESAGRSLFRALTFRTRFVRKWANINAYYVLSRNTSTDDNERNATGLFYENSYNLKNEYNLARLDRTHQFVANPIFFLPYGIEFSSAVRLRSGLPVDVVATGGDLNGDTGGPDRPLLVPGVSMKRNAYRNRAEYNVDIRAQKGFGLGESRRLVFSGEIFNLFNNANIQYSNIQTQFCTSLGSNTLDSGCGLNGATNPRFLQLRDSSGNILTDNFSRTPVFQMQLGVRLQF